MEMEPDVISQTALDQLVCSEQSQMLKALIPYTSSGNQQFLALYIEASPVACLLIGVGVPGPTALFGAFASDSAFSVYTADLFHKKNCHLQQAVHFLKYSYLSAFLKEV